MLTYEATATFDNQQTLVFELEEYQVENFVFAVFNKLLYKDEKTGVISWLPPERLLHLIVKPNLESSQCQKNHLSDLESDSLTSPNQ